MDRFIVCKLRHPLTLMLYLKSNMDRFIEFRDILNEKGFKDLKSNMDRFIVAKFL